MNRTSIFFTVTVSFIIALILLIVSFFVFINSSYELKETRLYYKYLSVAKKVILSSKTKINDDYEIILDKNEINALTYNPKTKVIVEKKSKKEDFIFRILQVNNNYFIYVRKNLDTILIKDRINRSDSTNMYIVLISLIIFITLILMYLITLRKLMPLKIFKSKVQELGEEKFDFECCNLEGKDEIVLLGKEFKSTALKLKEKNENRQKELDKLISYIENLKNKDEKIEKIYLKAKALKDTFS